MATSIFGKDTSCTTALRSGRLSSGPLLVAEAAFRRLTTPTGMLRGGDEEANYGIDLLELIGSANPRSAAAALPGRIQAELLKDERILEATASVSTVQNGPATEMVIVIDCTTAEGPFELTLGVDEVTVDILGIEA